MVDFMWVFGAYIKQQVATGKNQGITTVKTQQLLRDAGPIYEQGLSVATPKQLVDKVRTLVKQQLRN